MTIRRSGLSGAKAYSRFVAPLVFGALLLTACGTDAASSPSAAQSNQSGAASTIREAPRVAPVDRAFVDLAEDAAEEHPDVFSGSAWVGLDYSDLAVYYVGTQSDAPELQRLRRISSEAPYRDRVSFEPVEYSTGDLDEVARYLRPRLQSFEILALNRDVAQNRVTVGASADQIQAGGGFDELLASLKSEVPERLQDAVGLEEEEISVIEVEQLFPEPRSIESQFDILRGADELTSVPSLEVQAISTRRGSADSAAWAYRSLLRDLATC